MSQKGTIMEYKEFLNIINEIEVGEAVYFKPSEPSVMNAYHPDVKNHLFSLSMEPDGRYLFRYMVVIDGVRVKRGKLEEMFHEKKWMDYIPFDIIDDYNEWLLYHPEYCP